jgi:dihydrofolate synthase/folylpolyglutamate synthase
MGGRLDATNIVEPVLSVITDIALDHQDYLGSTIAAIAREKAGILRPEGTLITLPQHPEANQSIGEAAIALNVRGINAADYLPNRSALPNHNFTPAASTTTPPSDASSAASPDASRYAKPSGLALSNPEEGAALAPGVSPQVTTPLPFNNYDLAIDNQLLHVRSPLAGQHQQRNIALAIAAAIELRNTNRYKIPNAAIEAGIANTSWPGRLEFLAPNLLLDVAHNPAGAWTLRAAIATLPEDLPRTLIFSCLRDKDLTEMAQILFPLFDPPEPVRKGTVISTEPLPSPTPTSVISTEARSAQWRDPRIGSSQPPIHHIVLAPIQNPRAASLDDLLAAARKLSIPAHPAQNPAEALALARSLTPANGLIIATGSIYLIGALRDLILQPKPSS